ncbi:hypothetical protein ABH965_005841 [Bacillus sp. RC97]|nr:class III lanthipeptide [Bacillus thuringiensis]
MKDVLALQALTESNEVEVNFLASLLSNFCK